VIPPECGAIRMPLPPNPMQTRRVAVTTGVVRNVLGRNEIAPGRTPFDFLSRSSITNWLHEVTAVPASTNFYFRDLISVLVLVCLVACGGNGKNGGSDE